MYVSNSHTNKHLSKYGTTSYLLYTLAQLGFPIDIMRYGINVIMDVINLSVELSAKKSEDEEVIDLSDCEADMEG